MTLERLAIPVAFVTGAAAQYPPDLEVETRRISRVAKALHNSEPADTELASQMIEVVQTNVASIGDLPAFESTLTWFLNFADATPLPPDIYCDPKRSVELYSQVARAAHSETRCIFPPEQLEISMKICKGNLGDSLTLWALTSRLLARGMDNGVLPVTYGAKDMQNWACSLGSLGGDDVAGDTYHLSEAILLGVVASPSPTKRIIGETVCNLAPLVVDIARYQLCGRTGSTHGQIDALGFSIGTKMRQSLNATNGAELLSN